MPCSGAPRRSPLRHLYEYAVSLTASRSHPRTCRCLAARRRLEPIREEAALPLGARSSLRRHARRRAIVPPSLGHPREEASVSARWPGYEPSRIGYRAPPAPLILADALSPTNQRSPRDHLGGRGGGGGARCQRVTGLGRPLCSRRIARASRLVSVSRIRAAASRAWSTRDE